MVTLDAIYALVTETRDDVRDIKVKVDDLSDDSKDHETRLRSLERKIWWASGFAAVGGAGLWSQVGPVVGSG